MVGSLDALLGALKDTLAAAEELALGNELAWQLELAQRFHLCFSFCS